MRLHACGDLDKLHPDSVPSLPFLLHEARSLEAYPVIVCQNEGSCDETAAQAAPIVGGVAILLQGLYTEVAGHNC